MRSMTGYGAGRVKDGGWEVAAELKTVNHRFLDISMRLPRNIAFLEQAVREEIGKHIRRGHTDVYLSVRNTEESSALMTTDPQLAVQYGRAAAELAALTGMENDLSISRLLQLEGVVTLTEAEIDQETVTRLAREAVAAAAEQVCAMRIKEGANLQEDLGIHLDRAAEIRERILQRAPGVVAEYREKLETRIRGMIPEGVDPARVAQEVALMADRCAVDEELARLDSHIRQMRGYLAHEGEIGKKMDFLIQEMNRETNTIGSKAQDGEIAQWVVDLKSEIEKLREQIQNVE